jgi:hypothetical protein
MLFLVALANIYRIERQRNGFARWKAVVSRCLPLPCLTTQVQKEADEVFDVLAPQVEVDWALVAALDPQADGLTIWCNIPDNMKDP